MRDRTWTVSALIREVNALLEQGFSGIGVEGAVEDGLEPVPGIAFVVVHGERRL